MNFATIKYKDYVFKSNPRELKVSSIKDLKEIKLPFSGSVFQNFGREKRVVTGIGEFFGEDCIEQFNELFDIFKNKNSGFLSIPNMPPFLAEFKSLEMSIQTKPNVIEYSFKFFEDMSSTFDEDYFAENVHIVEEGEDLWDISYKYNIAIEKLLDLNKFIKNPNCLSLGEVVNLI